MSKKIYKILSLLLCFCLVFEQAGFAQSIGQLDISGYLTSLRNNVAQDKFRPLHLRYLSYDAQANNFKLLLDKGSLKDLNNQLIENTTKDLLKYFFIGISLPNDSFWVNLRPDSPDNIIDDYLAQTDVGKIMLESDLQLKKDTAKATSPETPEGKLYWDKLYQKANELFGSSDIEIPTLTRPWIVPGEIIIRETLDSAYIYKATLKVMLEQDYLKDSVTYNFTDPRLKALNEYSSQLIRELIIPKLTKEVNTSKRYAPLRQVYYSLILASWFKARNSNKDNPYSRLINSRNLTNLISNDNWSKNTYFKAYQENFKEGEYNIQKPIYTPYGQSIRSYFSGGIAGIQPEVMPAHGGVDLVASTGGLIRVVPATQAPVETEYGISVEYNGGLVHVMAKGVEENIPERERRKPEESPEDYLRRLKEKYDVNIIVVNSQEELNSLAIERRLSGSIGNGFGYFDRKNNQAYVFILRGHETDEQLLFHEITEALARQTIGVAEAGANSEAQPEPAGSSSPASRITRRTAVISGGAALAMMLGGPKLVRWIERQRVTNATPDELADFVLNENEPEERRQRAHQEIARRFYRALLYGTGEDPEHMQTKEEWNRRFEGGTSDNLIRTIWQNVLNWQEAHRMNPSANAQYAIFRHPRFLVAYLSGVDKDQLPYIPRSVAQGLLITMLRRTELALTDIRNDPAVALYVLRKRSLGFLWGVNLSMDLNDRRFRKDVQDLLPVFSLWTFKTLFFHLTPTQLQRQFVGERTLKDEVLRMLRFLGLPYDELPSDVKKDVEEALPYDPLAYNWFVQLRLSPQEYQQAQQWLVDAYSAHLGRAVAEAFVLGWMQTTIIRGRFREYPGLVLVQKGIGHFMEVILDAGIQQPDTVLQLGERLVLTAKARNEADGQNLQAVIYLLTLLMDRKMLSVRDGEQLLQLVLQADDPVEALQTLVIPALRERLRLWESRAPLPRVAGLPAWHQAEWQDVLIRSVIGVTFQDELFVSSQQEFLTVRRLVDQLGDSPKTDSAFLVALVYAVHAALFTPDVRERLPRGFALRHNDCWSNGSFHWARGDQNDPSRMQIHGLLSSLPSELSHAYSALLEQLTLGHSGKQDVGEFEDRIGAMALHISRPWLTYPEGIEWITAVMALGREYVRSGDRTAIRLLQEITDDSARARLRPSALEQFLMGLRAREQKFSSEWLNMLNQIESRVESTGVLMAKFQHELDAVGGIFAFQLNGTTRLRLPSSLPRFGQLDQDPSTVLGGAFHETSERLSAELKLQVIDRIQQANAQTRTGEPLIRPNLLPYLLIRAMHQTLQELYRRRATSRPAERIISGNAPVDVTSYLEVIRSIGADDVRMWVRQLIDEGVVERGKQIHPRSGPLDDAFDHEQPLGDIASIQTSPRLETSSAAEFGVPNNHPETPIGFAAAVGAIDARNKSSSAVQIQNQAMPPGGIDFRTLPIVTQAVSNLSLNLSKVPLERLASVNLTQEWQDIQRMVGAGITPSAERIKEYIQAACTRDAFNDDIDKVILCISNTLRQEEESCCSTDPVLRDILVVLESSKSVEELRIIFIGVKP